MEIKQVGIAGTLESSDIMVEVEKSIEPGIHIILKSSVEKQYGQVIRQVITDSLIELGIETALVKAADRGALDCTIRARVKTAVYRACESEDYQWGGR